MAAACYGSYLVPDGQAPLIGGGQAAVDAVVLTASGVRIRSGCPLVPAALRRLNSGWKVVARWDGCGRYRKVRLKASVSGDCARLRGRLTMRKAKAATRFTASPSRCGDGVVDAELGERCEPPGTAFCDAQCRRIYPVPPRCGDGVVDPDEECDDGNLMNGDGCNDCRLPRCGDGILDLGEQCDDGNTDDTDGCTNACQHVCEGQAFTSTWQAIETAIFIQRGCTNATCHSGEAPSGGLDLRPEAAWTSLVNVPSTIDPGTMRVLPGDQDASLLWRKLRAGVLGIDDVPGAPMPLGLAPLTQNELDAVRLWIRAGAQDTGVVEGTASLLDTCLGPATPPKIVPPTAPPPGEGIQLYAPPWPIAPHDEDEVCFATYYDITQQIQQARSDALIPCPSEWGGPGKQCFTYGRSDLTQDPNSHHSLIRAYRGAYPATDPSFGPYTCHGGSMNGQPCNPLAPGVAAPQGADCGARAGCAGRIVSTVACNLYGPPDFGFTGAVTGNFTAPTIGGSQAPHSTEAFPALAYSVLPTRAVIVWNSHAFNLTDLATTNEQWFQLYFAGPADRQYLVQALADDSQIFVPNVPPFATHEYCHDHVMAKGTRLFQLSSHTHKRGKLFRIWDPAGTLVLTTTEYSDPAVVRFDPPVALDGDDPASRTYRYCSLYDNGATDAARVKRKSTSPEPPLAFPGIGGPCSTSEVACMGGPRKGELCYDNDRQCDTTPGANDGVCDACPLRGGVTTEDEMFILLGAFYVVP